MKTAISIPDALSEAADRLAHRLNMSRSELYRAAIGEYLTRHAEDSVTERLNEVYGADEEAGRLPGDVARMQARSIPKEEW
jgi:metal-responsive CopG/Arc/MetJ family transcriptional regulator